MIRDVVLIDNFDSFTYNLAQYLEELDGVRLVVWQRDAFQVGHLASFDAIVISPGPGRPSSNEPILDVIRMYSGTIPILGICLGMQAICEAHGGRLIHLPVVHHGVTSRVDIVDPKDPVLHGISSPFLAGRYHSWTCDPHTFPADLIITATDRQGSIMACRHTLYPTFGVQFHPESILTPEGRKMIANFVAYQPKM